MASPAPRAVSSDAPQRSFRATSTWVRPAAILASRGRWSRNLGPLSPFRSHPLPARWSRVFGPSELLGLPLLVHLAQESPEAARRLTPAELHAGGRQPSRTGSHVRPRRDGHEPCGPAWGGAGRHDHATLLLFHNSTNWPGAQRPLVTLCFLTDPIGPRLAGVCHSAG